MKTKIEIKKPTQLNCLNHENHNEVHEIRRNETR